jgi:O-antigen ligase
LPTYPESKSEKIFVGSASLLALSAPILTLAAQLAALAVIISGVWLLVQKAGREKLPRWGSASLILFIVLVIISSLLSPNPRSSASQLGKTWALFCFFPLAIYRERYSGKTLLKLLLWGTVIASIVGIVRFLSGMVERAAPFSGGYTTMALFEAAMIPAAILFFAKGKELNRWFYFMGAVIMAIGLIFSETRAGWLAALVGMLILGIFINRRLVIIGILAVIALVAIIPQTRKIVIDRFQTEKQGGFTSGRSRMWEYSLVPLSHLPIFGYGPESFRRLIPKEILLEIGDPGVRSWHCAPLDILIESGPLALIALLSAVISFMVMALQNYRRSNHRIFYMMLFSIVAAFYLAALTTNIFRDFMLSTLLILFWAITLTPVSRLCEWE